MDCWNFDLCSRCVLDKSHAHIADHQFKKRFGEIEPSQQATELIIWGPGSFVPETLLYEPADHQYIKVKNHVYTISMLKENGLAYFRANAPFTRNSCYFEITLLRIGSPSKTYGTYPNPLLSSSEANKSLSRALGIGLATASAQREGMIGWKKGSWGYHSDNGYLYRQGPKGLRDYGRSFASGHTVGCGLDLSLQRLDPSIRAVFFTLNGQKLSSMIVDIREPVFPVVTVFGRAARFTVNFGPDWFEWKNVQYDAQQMLESLRL